MIGDIFLVSGDSKLAALNFHAQRLMSMHWRPREEFTHVAMGFGEWLAIHAMPEPWHVELVGLHELLGPRARWRAWRNPALAASLADEDRRSRKHFDMCSALGGSYNALFVMKNVPEASYCSQLVGRMAADLGHPFTRRSRVLMPLDIFEVVSSSDAWIEVTDEYEERLKNDVDFQRLHTNGNDRDAQAHYAAYLVSKGNLNEYLRGERAAFEGLLPNSRVDARTDGSIRVISIKSTPKRDERGLDGTETADLPSPYEGSVDTWSNKLDILRERVGLTFPSQMREMMDALRSERTENFPESAWVHDAVVVIGRSDLAKAAAILFDAVVPVGTDAVGASSIAFGSPPSLQQNATLFVDRIRDQRGAPMTAPFGLELPDGTLLRANAGDVDAEELLLASVLEEAYVKDMRRLGSAVLKKLADANIDEPALLLPSADELVHDDRSAEAWHLILEGVPLVDADGLSWEEIAQLRTDPGAMASFQLPRRLLTDPRAVDAGNIVHDLTNACDRLVAEAGRRGVLVHRATLGIVFAEHCPSVGRLPELLDLLDESAGVLQIGTTVGTIIVRLVEVQSNFGKIAETHRHVLTLATQHRA